MNNYDNLVKTFIEAGYALNLCNLDTRRVLELNLGFCSYCKCFHLLYNDQKMTDIFPDPKYKIKNSLLCFVHSILDKKIDKHSTNLFFNFNDISKVFLNEKNCLIEEKGFISVELESGIKITEGSYRYLSSNIYPLSKASFHTFFILLDDLYLQGRLQNSTIENLTPKDLKIITLLTKKKLYNAILNESTDCRKKEIFNAFSSLEFYNHHTDNMSSVDFILSFIKKILTSKLINPDKRKNTNKHLFKKMMYLKYAKTNKERSYCTKNDIRQFILILKSKSLDIKKLLLIYKNIMSDFKQIFDNFYEEMKSYYYVPRIKRIKKTLNRIEESSSKQFYQDISKSIKLPPLPGLLRTYMADFYEAYKCYLY